MKKCFLFKNFAHFVQRKKTNSCGPVLLNNEQTALIISILFSFLKIDLLIHCKHQSFHYSKTYKYTNLTMKSQKIIFFKHKHTMLVFV